MKLMEQVHLANENEDDLYAGFNDYSAALDTQEIVNDPAFQHAVKTSHGRRPPPTAMRGGSLSGQGGFGTAFPPSSLGRPGTMSQDGLARPMTAVRAAGFSSFAAKAGGFGDHATRAAAPPLETKTDDSPEEKIKQLEKKVNSLIEESVIANSRGDLNTALERAKEAGRKERVLVRQRDQISTGEPQINLDLTYSVLLNLALQYQAKEMYTEALNTYQVIVRHKMFSHAGRLKMNMGNIYFKQKNYSKATKFYRMALDQIPNAHKEMRIKVMQNIGIVFVKMGNYNDAITSFEHIMGESPNFKTGFNLILCYFTLGDRDRMKKAFQKLLSVDLKVDDEDKYTASTDDKQYNLVLEAIRNDSLRQKERQTKQEAENCIKMAAKVIAPAIESTFSAGYDWCVDQVKSSSYADLSHDLEIDKAIMFLKRKEFQQAVDTLKAFEKKDSRIACTAATNLSFLYLLEGDIQQGEKYAEVAMSADRYNPLALVNRGNCVFANKDFERAREFYKEALQNDSSCVEALFNLGLCNKKLDRLEDALDCFFKLHNILRGSAQVIYHIADLYRFLSFCQQHGELLRFTRTLESLYEQLGDPSQSQEWFMQLISLVPTDPGILSRLGDMYDGEGDKSQAFQYQYDSYRYFPSNIEVIEWLGAYYIDSQFCEKAIQYFERAAVVQPNQVKWQLMVASCHRRSGNYQQALETYKHIHKLFPDNIECLKFLVKLSSDMGLKESQDFANKLKKAEKAKELRSQRTASGRGGSGVRESSASSVDRLSSGESRDGNNRTRSKPPIAGGRRNRTDVLSARDDPSKPYEMSSTAEIDATYSDPMGPQVERPKTAARKREPLDDEFADEELGDDLLPE